MVPLTEVLAIEATLVDEVGEDSTQEETGIGGTTREVDIEIEVVNVITADLVISTLRTLTMKNTIQAATHMIRNRTPAEVMRAEAGTKRRRSLSELVKNIPQLMQEEMTEEEMELASLPLWIATILSARFWQRTSRRRSTCRTCLTSSKRMGASETSA